MADNLGHPGSWGGLPDYGITERISDFRDWLQGNPAGSGRTQEGGSDLDGSSARAAEKAADQQYQSVASYLTPPNQSVAPAGAGDALQKALNGSGSTNKSSVTAPTTESEQARRLRIWRELGNTGDVPVGWNPDDQNSSSPDWGSLLNDAYAPFVQTLQNWQNSINTGRTQDEALIQKQYEDTQKNLAGQKETESANLAEEGRKLWESLRSAMGESASNYSNRLRGILNTYGAGNSTGLTLSQLLANKQAQVEGDLREQNLQGERALSLESAKLSRYIDDKLNQLDTWKMGAMNAISQNVSEKLNQINAMRSESEINKTNAKIALLQQTQARQEQLAAEERAFRQNLAAWAVQQTANMQQDNFDVGSIPNVLAQVLGALNVNSSANPAQNYGAYSRPGSAKDELANIVK